jgi:hypothetical protein
MIKRQHLGILAVVLAVLVVLSWATSKKRYSTVGGGGFVAILTEPVDTGSIESIRAWLGSAPDSLVEIERTGEGWSVASRWGWAAKEDQVQRLLDDLGKLTGEKRASDEGVLADFQIDDESGLHVVAAAAGGSELFHLVVGKTAMRGGAFVRLHDSNDVYLTQAGLRSTFGVWGDEPKPPEARRWIDLNLHKADRLDVDKIVVRDGERELVLEKVFAETAPADTAAEGPAAEPQPNRSEWTWRPDSAGEIDKHRGDSILNTLCSVYASDVADPDSAEAYGLEDDPRLAELTYADGTVTRIVFGRETEDGKSVYFRVGDAGMPAQIYKSTVDRIFAERETLSPKEEETE